jgi:ABC-type polysaccharide/polyol phosphate transport system ATPase subunit
MTAVRFQHVSKRFILRHERARTFQEAALNLLRFRGGDGGEETFWALRDVSFTLERGRTLGIIGRNGSGKSTLLKLLARTMLPTSGTIDAEGRVFGLLELAAGFHPDLSGRENVFLNGTFLGLSRAEMAARLDEIVRFAELERFIDTPVKHYSSGMYMRLGFAIAVSVDPDVLVIDEVLAVGDAAFRQKCFGALAEMKGRGKTILFVTHDASAVRRFCDEALWLDGGTVRAQGAAADVLKEYLAETTSTHGEAAIYAARARDPLADGVGPVRLVSVEAVDALGRAERFFRPVEPVVVRLRYTASASESLIRFAVALHRADGFYVWGGRSDALHAAAGDGTIECRLGPLPLAAGEYTVSAAALVGDVIVHRLARAVSIALRPRAPDQAGLLEIHAEWGAVTVVEEAPPIVQLAGSAADVLGGESDFRVRWRPAPARLTMGQAEDEFLGYGWYPPEDWPPVVRWTAATATAYLTQDQWTAALGLSLCRPQHSAEVVRGRVVVDGRVVAPFELASPAIEPFTFPLEPVSAPHEVEVRIEIENPLVPAAEATDQRVLGVAVRELWLE